MSCFSPLALVLALAWLAPIGAPQEQRERGAWPVQDGAPPLERISKRVILPRDKHPLFMELTLAGEDTATPMLVLFHEARSSLGEYRPLVPRLRELGYNCLSVDLTYGIECREVKNQTAHVSSRSGHNPTYLDALPDMLDALLWAREHHAHDKLVVWGSGYSASLAFVLAAEHPDLVDGVVAFSPGEYFTAVEKSASWIQETARQVECPVFVGSSRKEEGDWKPIFEALASSDKVSFLPSEEGVRGSRALWEESPGSAEVRAALEGFLKARFPVPAPAAPPEDH